MGVGRRRRPAYGVVHQHVVRDAALSVNARMLYTLLCCYASNAGIASAKASTLAAELGVSDMTRKRAQRELVAAGYLEVEQQYDARGAQWMNVYILVDDLVPARAGGGNTHEPPQGGNTDDPPGQITDDPPGGSQVSPPKGGARVSPLELLGRTTPCDHGYDNAALCAICRRRSMRSVPS